MSQYLDDRQIKIGNSQRFNIFLTNTLEPLEPQRNFFLPALSDETKRAAEVKKRPILVITGNPPYSGHSLNKGSWITEEVKKYRENIPELNRPGQAKWLQDDYVKFFRFAEEKMERVPEGIVGVITNNAYLDNATFLGMRKCLMRTFDQIFLMDLHGSTKKKEKSPDGSQDENVFDIQQGVAIALLVKKPGLERGVWRADIWGKRLDKYKRLADAEWAHLPWKRLSPAEPFFLFVVRDEQLATQYNDFWSVPQIFGVIGDPAPGMVTTHDAFAISFTPDQAIEKVKRLLATRDEADARKLFKLCSQSQWSYARAKQQLARTNFSSLVAKVLYRPFDQRWTIWDSNVAVHRRERVMRHMLDTYKSTFAHCRSIPRSPLQRSGRRPSRFLGLMRRLPH